jgi:hypothetical protein
MRGFFAALRMTSKVNTGFFAAFRMTDKRRLHAEEGGHFVVEETVAGTIWLDPFTVEYELRDGTLADVSDDLLCGAWGVLDVDLFVGDGMLVEEALGFAAVAAPAGGVKKEFHNPILLLIQGEG